MLKAIDTAYKGHLFRSRLEARWAVFFDALGLQWEYEVEGYDLDGVWYLPDFKVKTPQGSIMWIEVKNFETRSDKKFARFSEAVMAAAGHGEWPRTALVFGTPLQFINCNMRFCPRCGLPTDNSYSIHGMMSGSNAPWYDYWCDPCDFETPSGGDNPRYEDGLNHTCYVPHKGRITVPEMEDIALQRRVRSAAEKAQKARFEHGAHGG